MESIISASVVIVLSGTVALHIFVLSEVKAQCFHGVLLKI